MNSGFLSSYVGSKRAWIDRLYNRYSNRDIVELFAGSAVISANLAKTAVLNDTDKYVYNILKYFDQLIVPDEFTQDDYFECRKKDDWWKYAFCLSKMSFSGVFRHSKNGFNVPVKENIKAIRVRREYEESLKRWHEIKPHVLNLCYYDVDIELIKNKLLICDPPYQKSQASYNTNAIFDYNKYWEYVRNSVSVADTVILFDRKENLLAQGFPVLGERVMCVNGKHKSDVESVSICEKGNWLVAGLRGFDWKNRDMEHDDTDGE